MIGSKYMKTKLSPSSLIALVTYILHYIFNHAKFSLFYSRKFEYIPRNIPWISGWPTIIGSGRIYTGKGVVIKSTDYPVEILTGPKGNVHLGDNVAVTCGCIFNSADDISIGDETIIGHHCYMIDSDVHAWDNKRIQTAPIKIGKHVWIGIRVTILKGVTIGDNAIIGAGSVVTHDIPAFTIAAGNPAREIYKTETGYQ
jgi:acetyltransferase-like isoleucine patch superfamily enzyme